MPRKLNYSEGDAFAVPLNEGGYGLGVAARISGKGTVVGYFFPPRYDDVPDLDDVGALNPEASIHVMRFGDLGLIRGAWPVLGRLPGWRREDWRTPAFGRHEELSGRFLRVEYPDDDPEGRPREREVPREEFEELPQDGLAGFAFIEDRLTDLLG